MIHNKLKTIIVLLFLFVIANPIKAIANPYDELRAGCETYLRIVRSGGDVLPVSGKTIPVDPVIRKDLKKAATTATGDANDKTGVSTYETAQRIGDGTATLRNTSGDLVNGIEARIEEIKVKLDAYLHRGDLNSAIKLVIGLTFKLTYPWLNLTDVKKNFRALEVSAIQIYNAMIRLRILENKLSLLGGAQNTDGESQKMHVLQILLLEEINFINHWAVVFAENFYIYKLLRYHLEFLTKKALCSDRCKKTAEELMDYLGVFADPMIRSAHFDGFTQFKAEMSLLGIDITPTELKDAFDWEKGAEEWRQQRSQELSSAVASEQGVRALASAAPTACIATIPNADIWNQHEVLGWDTLELIATLPPVAIEMLVVERRFQRRHFVHQVFSRPNTVLLLDLVVGRIAKKIPGIRSVYNNTLGAWVEKLLTNHRARADHFYPLINLIREKSESLELLKTLNSMSIADPEILVTASRLLEFSFTWNTLLFAAEKLKKEAEARKAAGEAPQEFDREISELVKRMNDASTVAEKLGKLSLLYQQSLMHTVSDLMLIVGSTWGAVHYSSPLLQHLTQLLK